MDRRQILRASAAGLAMFVLPRVALAQGADPFALVDPELRPMARLIARAAASGDGFKPPASFPLPNGVVERSVPGPKGAPPVTVYVINAREGGTPRGAILHIHGGGFVGGHAAMLAIAARDRGAVPIAFQALVYPMLDDRTGSTRAVPPQIGTLIWTAHDNRNGWSALLGQPAGGAKAPLGAVPARVRQLAGLPPAFIGVGTLDLFVNEDIEYARRLITAGVPTELMVVPGAFHGFEQIVPQAGVSKRFTAALEHALARALTSGRTSS